MNTDTRPATLLPLVIADIYELAGRFRAHGETIAGAVGQTQARWQVMSAASGEPRTVPQIGRRLGVTRQNVQRIADVLVAQGLARLDANPDHRASPYLVLSPRGRQALDQLGRAAAAYHARLARKLAGHDIAAAHRSLRRLVEAVAALDSSQPHD